MRNLYGFVAEVCKPAGGVTLRPSCLQYVVTMVTPQGRWCLAHRKAASPTPRHPRRLSFRRNPPQRLEMFSTTRPCETTHRATCWLAYEVQLSSGHLWGAALLRSPATEFEFVDERRTGRKAQTCDSPQCPSGNQRGQSFASCCHPRRERSRTEGGR